MTVFLQHLIELPTAFYTGLLTLLLLYWGFVIVGALDIDMFDGGLDGVVEGATEGATEGVAEGLAEGAAEGLAEGIAEGAAEGLAEGIAEGAAEGIAEGVAEGVAEGAAEGAADGVLESAGEGVNLIALLGLRRAPVTVVASLLVLGAWAFSMLGMMYLAPVLAPMLPLWLIKSGIFVGAFALALPFTSITTKPLAPVFEMHEADRSRDLVGRTCRIDTGYVDGRFGQATLEEGSGSQKIQVRNDKGAPLERGDEALIIAYDPEREAFRVERLRSANADSEAGKKRNRDADAERVRRRQQGQSSSS